MEELRLCPFCNGEAQLLTDHVYSDKPRSHVWCKQCKASTDWYFYSSLTDRKGEERAREAWNKRTLNQ